MHTEPDEGSEYAASPDASPAPVIDEPGGVKRSTRIQYAGVVKSQPDWRTRPNWDGHIRCVDLVFKGENDERFVSFTW